MKKTLIILAAFTCLFGCSGKGEKEVLFAEVMKTHDELMPKLGDISSLSKSLKEKASADSTKSQGKADLTTINKKVTDLQEASGSMMDWMHNFNTHYDTLPENIAVEYLKEEKLEVDQLKKKMETAISDAQTELKK